MSGEETTPKACRVCNKEAVLSMNENDLRVRRTLDSIRDALAALVAKKGLDAVTVEEIARRARVNRTTFYRHFKNKYELLESMLAKAMEEMDESMGPRETRRSRYTLDEVPGPWIRFFERIEENADLYRAIDHSSGGAWFQARLRARVERLLQGKGADPIPSKKRPTLNDTLPHNIFVAFSASLFVGVAMWWLEYGRAFSAAQVATWLRRYFLHGISGRRAS